jgi:hypothetical protein
VTATLTNTGRPGCGRPVQGAQIKFRVLAGPNAGKTARAVTNIKGRAKFTYTSSQTGTDDLQAATTNPVGTVPSPKVMVKWTKP